MKFKARWIFCSVTGTGRSNSLNDWLANVITWTVSIGRHSLSIFCIAPITLAVGSPDIEPETSTRNTISRGGLFVSRSSSCG